MAAALEREVHMDNDENECPAMKLNGAFEIEKLTVRAQVASSVNDPDSGLSLVSGPLLSCS
jgi:hypothetical protein